MMNKKSIIIFTFFLLISISVLSIERFITYAEETSSSIDLSLEEKMNGILKDERLNGAIIGISVRIANSGEEIYENYGNTRLHPASNLKILTAITALETLGKDYRFETNLYTDGIIKGQQLQGNLYIQGKGDPTLRKEDLDQFALSLKEKGIKEITGRIIGDDSWYDDVRLSQDLNWSDESFHTGAQISALTLSPNEDYDAGTIMIEISPGKKINDVATLHVIPQTDYVTIENKVRTVAKGEEKKLSIEREHGGNRIFIDGTIPMDASPNKSWVAVWDPTKYVLDVFRKSLKNHGITVKENSINVGTVPEKHSFLMKKQSPPLKELLQPFMKLSNNGHGEVLVKEMGRVAYEEGTWDNGIKVMEQKLANLDVDLNYVQIRDGSGMSHKNYVTASELTKMLYMVQEKEWFLDFFYSLPIAGETRREIGGTLRNRLKEEATKGRVYAKTGSITGVNTLSGYITTINDEKLIFSILVNNYVEESVTDIVDKIVYVLATHKLK